MIRHEYVHTGLQVCDNVVVKTKPAEVPPELLVFSVDQRCRWYDTGCAIRNQSTDQGLDKSFFVFTGQTN